MTDNKNVRLCVNKNKNKGQVIHDTATMKNQMKKKKHRRQPIPRPPAAAA